MKNIIKPIITRLGQESSWRGIITVATLLGVHMNPSQIEAIVSLGVSLIAAINILKND